MKKKKLNRSYADDEVIQQLGVEVVRGNIANLHEDGTLKHNEHEIAKILHELVQ